MVLPGMDSALVLNAIRSTTRGKYDVIVYDGSGDLHSADARDARNSQLV